MIGFQSQFNDYIQLNRRRTTGLQGADLVEESSVEEGENYTLETTLLNLLEPANKRKLMKRLGKLAQMF